jgi:hypothetical protein
LRYRVALAYHNQDWGTLLGSEVEWIGKELFFRSGAELKLIEQFSVRAGIDQISRFAKTDAKPSFGFSVTTHFQNWETSVYYTYVIENIAPSNIHLISVAIRRQ